jgi:hypothetical protein
MTIVFLINQNYNYAQMATYLIEIPHSENTFECKQVIKLFVESGSHLLANAQWGCKSGVHKSWFINDFASKEEALQIIPPFLRHNANIIELVTFTKEDIVAFGNASNESVNN